MFPENEQIIGRFLTGVRKASPSRFQANQWPIVEAIFNASFQDVDLSRAYPKPIKDIVVTGRNGAGKSTFTQNYSSSPLFGALYELDTDRVRKIAEEHGDLTLGTAIFGSSDVGEAIMEFLDSLDVPTIHTEANLDFNAPFGRIAINYQNNPADIMHVFLCDSSIAISRVEKRMERGGHPDHLDDFVRFSQARFILGLGEFVQKSDRFFLIFWDSSIDGYVFPLISSQTNTGHKKIITVHNSDKLAGFGHDETSLKMLILISRKCPEFAKQFLEGIHMEIRSAADQDNRTNLHHNDRFKMPVFLDNIVKIKKSWPEMPQLDQAIAASRRIFGNPQNSVAGVTIRTADDKDRLPPLDIFQVTTDSLPAYRDFFAAESQEAGFSPTTKPLTPRTVRRSRVRTLRNDGFS